MAEIEHNINRQNKNESGLKSAFVFYLMGAALIAVDQIFKFLIFNFLSLISSPKGLGIQTFKNSQFAFSWPLPTVLIYIIYALVLSAIIFYILKKHHEFNFKTTVAWTLILAGALSNIGERIALGYVRDFIYIFSGIFNLADFYIMVGILILLFSKSIKK